MLLNMIHFGQIGDVYLFAVKASEFWFLAFATLLLGIASVWLARRPQPTPNARAWALPDAKRRHPSNSR
ncbi:MAG TPA: hypothetical protein VHC20_06085 [Candidatus Paceibacterota bacterium]|nr:hypothetical protein [Candidatus Paceibacterota bacterium]